MLDDTEGKHTAGAKPLHNARLSHSQRSIKRRSSKET